MGKAQSSAHAAASGEATTAADRTRGVQIVDPNGNPVGVIDSSDNSRVIIIVNQYKVQVPASAVTKGADGRLSIGATADQVGALIAVSAEFQRESHPQPAPPPMPAFEPLPASLSPR